MLMSISYIYIYICSAQRIGSAKISLAFCWTSGWQGFCEGIFCGRAMMQRASNGGKASSCWRSAFFLLEAGRLSKVLLLYAVLHKNWVLEKRGGGTFLSSTKWQCCEGFLSKFFLRFLKLGISFYGGFLENTDAQSVLSVQGLDCKQRVPTQSCDF